jgi:hypothetical protein
VISDIRVSWLLSKAPRTHLFPFFFPLVYSAGRASISSVSPHRTNRSLSYFSSRLISNFSESPPQSINVKIVGDHHYSPFMSSFTEQSPLRVSKHQGFIDGALTCSHIIQMLRVSLPCDVQRAIWLSLDSIQAYRLVVVLFPLMNCGVFIESPCKTII